MCTQKSHRPAATELSTQAERVEAADAHRASPSDTKMKPRLHIPLKQNPTTRQRRRVVWITAEFLLGFAVLFGGGRLFLLRDSLLAMAPVETDVAVSLAGERALSTFFETFGNHQAVSSSPLRFNDLKPYVGRELAVFLDAETGTSLVAFAGKLPDEVKNLWGHYGLLVQQNGGTLLLGPQEANFQKTDRTLTLAALFPNYAGRIRMSEETGSLFLHPNGILAKVHTGVDKARSKTLLAENTIALVPIGLVPWIELGIDSTGVLHLTHDEEGVGFFLQIDQKLESQFLAKLVQKIALLQRPEVRSVALSDQSSGQEIRLNEEKIDLDIEEREQGVRIVGSGQGSQTIIGWSEWEKTFLTNREATQTGDTEHGFVSSCLKSGNSFLFPKKLAATELFQTESVYQPPTWLILFEEIAISQEKVKFCW